MIENYLNQAVSKKDEHRLAQYFNDACRKSNWVAENHLSENMRKEVTDLLYILTIEKYKTTKKATYKISGSEMRDLDIITQKAKYDVNASHICSGRA